MRALIACVLLAGCITDGPPRSPPEQLAGCWINRDSGAVAMRWAPDPNRAGVLLGTRTALGVGDQRSENYTLEPDADGWKLCRAGDGHCWSVAHGSGGSLEGGRAFIDTLGDGLRITVAGDGPDRVIFQGRRNGCG